MKKFFVCLAIFAIITVGSAYLGVLSADTAYVLGIICAVLYLIFSGIFSRKKRKKKSSREEEFQKAEQDFERYMSEWSDEYNKNVKKHR